jgi:transcriptional regulator GlxA family with amidase domain
MRVAEVQRRLADPAERGELIAIALDAGFSSKVSSNRAFTSHMGTTPSAFRATSQQHR